MIFKPGTTANTLDHLKYNERFLKKQQSLEHVNVVTYLHSYITLVTGIAFTFTCYLLITINIKQPIGMSNIFYVSAAILCIIWAIGFFMLNAGILIHLLLVIAFISVILSIIETKEVYSKN